MFRRIGFFLYPPPQALKQQYTYFNDLLTWKPTQGDHYNGKPETYIPPESNETRITFLGSNIPNQLRRAQQMMSIFVEVGNAIGDPYAQIDTSTEVPSCDDGNGNCNYREDGY